MYLHVNYVKWGGMVELKGNVIGKHTNAHFMRSTVLQYVNCMFWALLAHHQGGHSCIQHSLTFISPAVYKKFIRSSMYGL